MDIERVNEHTVKFFITYRDIEDRGFDKEEIWYNRERGEELFWEMMDEAHHQEEFPLEGPLWIQVQALDKGLEIIVTKAQLSNDGSKLELPIGEDKQVDLPVDDNIEKLLDQQFKKKNEEEEFDFENEDYLSFLIGFKDFEDVISLSHHFNGEEVVNSLYVYKDSYYLYVTFEEDSSEKYQDDQLSQLLEYGFESNLTIYMLEEYGKVIMKEAALEQVKKHFSL
ncbi:adaptor protein MecA [Bacillus taeanensis]|uniref:Adapter protein MecA n=1 Tax=Bacillus taeanensis TaxID=273032 RepID=A0A366XUZ0_9BACI|nr:adaptor protein MecA [Bacillus taeanensis]RBW69942.1 adaptor protein MecA [Bacillus taeanensis]